VFLCDGAGPQSLNCRQRSDHRFNPDVIAGVYSVSADSQQECASMLKHCRQRSSRGDSRPPHACCTVWTKHPNPAPAPAKPVAHVLRGPPKNPVAL